MVVEHIYVNSKISQASVTDLSEKMNNVCFSDESIQVINQSYSIPICTQAANNDNSQLETLKSLMSQLPIGGSGSSMDQGANLQQQSRAYNFNPDNVAPPEVQQQLFELLAWRDGVYRDISKKIEAIPGLSDLLDNLTNALNACERSFLNV